MSYTIQIVKPLEEKFDFGLPMAFVDNNIHHHHIYILRKTLNVFKLEVSSS